MIRRVALPLAAVLAALLACAETPSPEVPAETVTAEAPAPITEPAAGPHVTAAEFGDAWPLTVDTGTLRCSEQTRGGYEQHEVTIETEVGVIALNGTAIRNPANLALRDRRDLWRNDPNAADFGGTVGDEWKVSPDALASRGLALCDE